MAIKHPSKVKGIVAMSSISRAAPQAVLDAFAQFYNGWVSIPTPSEDLLNLGLLGWGGEIDVTSDRCEIIKREWTERQNRKSQVGCISHSVNYRHEFVDKLASIKVPVLLIHGEKDLTWSMRRRR